MMNKNHIPSILLILKAHYINAWGINKFIKGDAKTKLKFAGFAFAMFLVGCMFAVYSGLSIYGSYTILSEAGLLDAVLAGPPMLAFIAVLFFGMYKAPGFLFNFRDHDLLMSLPISTNGVLGAKVLLFTFSNYLFSTLIAAPAIVVFGILNGEGWLFYLYGLILVLFTPLIPASVAAVLTFGIAIVSSRFKQRNLVTIILSFAAVLGIMAVSFQASSVTNDMIVQIGQALEVLRRIYPPAAWFADALIHQNFATLLLFAGTSSLIFLLVVFAFSSNFQKINAKFKETPRGRAFQGMELKTSTALVALVKRELRNYVTCFIYLFNTFFGMVLLTIVGIATILFGPDVLNMILPAEAGIVLDAQLLAPIATALVAFTTVMTATTASSISLEGKQLWIIKSAPVSTGTIFLSKIIMNLLLTVPFILFNGVLISIALGFSPIAAMVLIAIGFMFAVFTSLYGLIVNLYLPKLEFTSPAVVVKQSSAAMTGMFGGIIFAVALAILYIYLGLPYPISGLLMIALLALINVLLGVLLKTKGVALFDRLH